MGILELSYHITMKSSSVSLQLQPKTKANQTLGCGSVRGGGRGGERMENNMETIAKLLCKPMVYPHLEHFLKPLPPHLKKNLEKAEGRDRRTPYRD